MKWVDLQSLRHRSGRFTEEWTAKGPNIYCEEWLVAECATAELASLVADQHNAFIELVNSLVMLVRKLGDRHAAEAEDQD